MIISDDMSNDEIKSEIGKTIAIIEVNGFLQNDKIDFNRFDCQTRHDYYPICAEAQRAALALKNYRPKNKKFAELAEKLTTVTEALDESFALDDAEKNCQSAAEKKEINNNLKKLQTGIKECLPRARILGKEIEKQDEKASTGRKI